MADYTQIRGYIRYLPHLVHICCAVLVIAARAPAFDGPRIVTHEVEDKPEYQRPYLILDLRTPHEFQACHILQGTSAFPFPC